MKPVESGQGRRGGDILVVDDAESQLRLLTDLLTRAGHQVRPASTAGMALRSIKARLPDLILLDVRMPGIDGYELCRQLKADESTHSVPVIFISASVEPPDKTRGFAVGAVDFIIKPFYEAEVLARVATHLALYHAQQDLERANTELQAEVNERRRVESAFQKSAEQYRTLTESIKDVVWVLDTATLYFSYVSPSVERLRGYTADEIMANPVDAALTPEGAVWLRHEMGRQVEAFLSGTEPPDRFYTSEVEQPCKDGSSVWTEAVTSYYRDAETGHVVVRGVTRDISERKKLEEEIAHMASFPTQNPSPIIEVLTNGVVRFANAAAVATLVRLGLDADVRRFLPGTPDELALLRSQCEQNPQTLEVRIGGATFLRTVSAYGDNTLRVYATDITERSRIASELAATHAALLEAQAIGHIGDWSIDAATRRFSWSDELYAIHGIQLGTEILHDTYLELMHPEDRQHVLEVMRSGMAGNQQEFVVDYRIVLSDGTERFISLTGRTLADDSGAVVGIRGTMQDITDRKRAEAEKEAMQAQSVQSKKLEAVGQLAGGVAHNFNNLLTGVLGNIDMARSDIDARHPASSSLDAARAATLRAAALARQLVSFGRGAVLVPTVQSAATAVQAALDIICLSLPDSIEIVRKASPDAWDIIVDSSKLTQVLLELIDNAREAMGDSGTITIGARNVTVDEGYVATTPFARVGDFVVVSVADSGPGIAPAILDRLFEPFVTTRQFGRGLGLPAVFGAIKQAGGWILVDSSPGEGTTFDLFLPRDPAASPQLHMGPR
jgi:two-component system cell cycle sensor histidine kinase/response regulator CckA